MHTIIGIALNTKVFSKVERILSFDFRGSRNFIQHIVLYRKIKRDGDDTLSSQLIFLTLRHARISKHIIIIFQFSQQRDRVQTEHTLQITSFTL